MKKLLSLAIIFGLIWQGNELYQKYSSTLFQQQNQLSINPSSLELKCITKEGKVFYGEVPKNVTCEKREEIKNSLTILPTGFAEKTNNSTANQQENVIQNFKCDGRTQCSQMTSCQEANFFLQNCPNVQMDGNHDGIPCEKQWCK